MTKSYVNRIIRLAFLSPSPVAAALAGRLRSEVLSAALKLEDGVPASWEERARRMLRSLPRPAGRLRRR